MVDRLIETLTDLARRAMREHHDDSRKTVYADVCTASADGIDAMAREIGCSRAAMIDALGHALSSAKVRQLMLEAGPTWPAIANKAREIDSDRRSRQR